MKAFFIFNNSPLTVELCYKHKKACKMQAFFILNISIRNTFYSLLRITF